jgi:DNA polymerase III subunit gamma/tau
MDDTSGTPESNGLALPGLEAPPAPAPPAYRVLARKYRPRTFDDLIGQDAMVRTLSNAFKANRIPQSWMLTGVRGVGKTTTARILARALNYTRPGGPSGPTIEMPELGEHCAAIIEGRHIDVIEIDAASNNGVENIRQISDAVRYAPVSARYKVYIVDEVHMLSTQAFNAFLKTLEEPPPHAKFVFATTEIRKVPVTILSRCQRFDLRRIPADRLVQHLERVCALEGVASEPEALAVIARAAEGSVRDALSLLDQAIAHGSGTLAFETVRDMLGLADRTLVIGLFEAAMRGDLPAAFANLQGQYEAGADPAAVLTELAAFTHLVTRLKIAPDAAKDPSLSEAERLQGAAFAGALSMRALSRAWQILLAALPEVKEAPRPLAAAEMALVRLAYAADLPTPDEALRALRRGEPMAAAAAPPPAGSAPRGSPSNAALAPALASAPAPGPALRRFEDVVALAGQHREVGLKAALERDARLVRFEDGRIELSLAEGASRTLPNELARALQGWTGRRWVVAVAAEGGGPTLHERRLAEEQARRGTAESHPLVQAVLSRFPGAEIVGVRDRASAQGPFEEPDPAVEILGEEDAAAAHETEADDDL